MSARNLLDIVCFQNTHTHIQPIVLVERLEKRNQGKFNPNEEAITATPSPVNQLKIKKKKRLPSDNNWVINKRIVKQMGEKQRVVSQRIENHQVGNYKVRKRAIMKTKKVIFKKRAHGMLLRPRELLRPPNLLQIPISSNLMPPPEPPKQIGRKRRVRRRSPSEFSADDNRPLKYFAKSYSQWRRSYLHSSTSYTSVATTKTAVPTHRAVLPMISKTAVRTSAPVQKTTAVQIKSTEVLSTSKAVPRTSARAPRTRARALRTRARAPSTMKKRQPVQLTERDLSNVPTTSGNTCAVSQRLLDELKPSAGHSSAVRLSRPTVTDAARDLRPANAVSRNSTSPVSYYSEQGIHRWMEGSLHNQNTILRGRRPELSNPSDEAGRLQPDTDDYCIAAAWRTVKDVIKAPKALFDAKCNLCRPCQRINKHIKLSNLLKKQSKIEFAPPDTRNSRSTTKASNFYGLQRNRNSTSKDKSEINEEFNVELLPRHPHLVLKLKITKDSGKPVYSGCLLPRSEAHIIEDFVLVDNEATVNELIVTLSLNLGHRPPAEVPGPSAEPTTSREALLNEKINAPPDAENQYKGPEMEAPTFWPTPEEFQCPFTYLKKIWNSVEQYGICKIVPPENFEPTCKADDDIRFEVSNQYTARLYQRWGSAIRELSVIKACLRSQNITMSRHPVLEGVEINLPKLYHLVHEHGGLENVINKKKWGKVAEDMNFNRNPFTERKLDKIYVRYLLPYATLTNLERAELFFYIESIWNQKYQETVKRAINPLHRQEQLLNGIYPLPAERDNDFIGDAEDGVTRGNNMNLAKFKKIARHAFNLFFKNQTVSTREVEDEYWRLLVLANEHVCVNSASIDTGAKGLGFSKKNNDGYNKHPWNLKQLSNNSSNILRYLGRVLGMTVPTLHLGMVFSTSCWHRDPHCLPWVQYQHTGPTNIWYGIPESEGNNFRNAAETLNPAACQNKTLWLSSDVTIIPPNLLRQSNVKVYRLEQNPGEFVLILPKAYCCSISTGFTISESVYFATEAWLDSVLSVYSDIRQSNEPTMFSFEQLLKHIADDPKTPTSVLEKVYTPLETIFTEEINNRDILIQRKVKVVNRSERAGLGAERRRGRKPVLNVRDQEECEFCRCTLFLSKVKNIPVPNSMVCSTHAIQLLDNINNKVSASELELIPHFETKTLRLTLSTLRKRLGILEPPVKPAKAEISTPIRDKSCYEWTSARPSTRQSTPNILVDTDSDDDEFAGPSNKQDAPQMNLDSDDEESAGNPSSSSMEPLHLSCNDDDESEELSTSQHQHLIKIDDEKNAEPIAESEDEMDYGEYLKSPSLEEAVMYIERKSAGPSTSRNLTRSMKREFVDYQCAGPSGSQEFQPDTEHELQWEILNPRSLAHVDQDDDKESTSSDNISV